MTGCKNGPHLGSVSGSRIRGVGFGSRVPDPVCLIPWGLDPVCLIPCV